MEDTYWVDFKASRKFDASMGDEVAREKFWNSIPTEVKYVEVETVEDFDGFTWIDFHGSVCFTGEDEDDVRDKFWDWLPFMFLFTEIDCIEEKTN